MLVFEFDPPRKVLPAMVDGVPVKGLRASLRRETQAREKAGLSPGGYLRKATADEEREYKHASGTTHEAAR